MKPPNLLRHFFIRSTLYTFAAGFLLGGAFGAVISILASISTPGLDPAVSLMGPLILVAVSIPVGAIIGGTSGATIGALNGTITGLLTQRRYYPLTNEQQYKTTTRLLTPLLTILESMLIGPLILIAFFQTLSPTDSTTYQQAVLDWIIPTLIAACAALWANERVTQWYITQAAIPSGSTSNIDGNR